MIFTDRRYSSCSCSIASCLDWKNLILETKVNGEVRQNQNTAELIFDIPTLIETCSLGMTLQVLVLLLCSP